MSAWAETDQTSLLVDPHGWRVRGFLISCPLRPGNQQVPDSDISAGKIT